MMSGRGKNATDAGEVEGAARREGIGSGGRAGIPKGILC